MSNCAKTRWFFGGIFFASLALNLFLGGWLFGDGGFQKGPSSGGRGAFFEAFNDKAAALPEPERAAVQKVLNRHQPGLKKQMRRIMKSRDAIDTMFQRKDYTRAEAEERFALMQDLSIEMQEKAQSMMLDLADALPADQRAAFMKRPKDMRGRGEEFRHPPKKTPVAKAAPETVVEAAKPETPIRSTKHAH